ncbi:GAF domain-containing protein [Dokdonella sp. MW10]|uniref:GAF domain-containing protein n=1 Tax=Dokdonella sp. MW10 TaxID=2992926 RepID=UPI003F812952
MKTSAPQGDTQQPTVIGFEMPSVDVDGEVTHGVMSVLLDVLPSLKWAVSLTVLHEAFAREHRLDVVRLVGSTLTLSGPVDTLRKLSGDVRDFVQSVSNHCMRLRHARLLDDAQPVGTVPLDDTAAPGRIDLQLDLDAIRRIAGIPAMLEAVVRAADMRFAAVARVTDTEWTACVVRDLVGFGLQAGQDLALETTICNEIRQHGKPVYFDSASRDDTFANHPTPAMYGFESYISVPIHLPDGTFFGTLCALDPKPAKITVQTVRTLEMFATVIGREFDAERGNAP